MLRRNRMYLHRREVCVCDIRTHLFNNNPLASLYLKGNEEVDERNKFTHGIYLAAADTKQLTM